MSTPEDITLKFYYVLRKEIIHGNPYLNGEEQKRLQSHYDVIMNPKKYPPALAATMYSHRRAPAVRTILEQQYPVVLDAGCGYGSESFLFAAVGARVLAVDISSAQIAIARKRKLFFEKKIFGQELDINFEVADLNRYVPPEQNLSLTWLASVLAALPDQDDFLRRIYAATREGGCVMVTDMNLLNPLFLFKEWWRRQRAKAASPEFSRQANFWKMVRRHGRAGARSFPLKDGSEFDDVQFFAPGTLVALLNKVGFQSSKPLFSGFLPPWFYRNLPTSMEISLTRELLLNNFAYFYLVASYKGAISF
jgi:SAM-dependent methyltransferase